MAIRRIQHRQKAAHDDWFHPRIAALKTSSTVDGSIGFNVFSSGSLQRTGVLRPGDPIGDLSQIRLFARANNF